MSIRTVSADGSETSEWMPVGGLAVPRSNSVDTAVSMAIFNNEDELLKGAFRRFPKLKTSKDKFEYGYRLREFPEDEVRAIAHHAASLLPLSCLRAPARPLPPASHTAHPPHTLVTPSSHPHHTLTTPSSHPPHTLLAPSQVKVAMKDAGKESTNPFMRPPPVKRRPPCVQRRVCSAAPPTAARGLCSVQ